MFDNILSRSEKNSPFIGVSENSVNKRLRVEGRLDRQVKKRKPDSIYEHI